MLMADQLGMDSRLMLKRCVREAMQHSSIKAIGGQLVLFYGTACTGSDILNQVLRHVMKVFTTCFAHDEKVEYVHECRFGAENDAQKQKFLIRHQLLKTLFGNASELALDVAENVVDKVAVPVPWCFLFAAGFSCKSRSPINRRSSTHKHCVQCGDDETGETFSFCASYITRCKPTIVILENVQQLAEEPGPDDDDITQSDADWICGWLQGEGYMAWRRQFCASSYGSVSRRVREYFFGMRIATNDTDIIRECMGCFDQLMDEFKISPVPMNLVLLSDNRLMCIEHDHSADEAGDVDEARRKKAKKAVPGDFKYKDEHIEIFKTFGLTWPPDLDSAREINYHGMHHRQCELAFFYHQAFPMPDHEDFQFVDLLPSITRTLRWNSETASHKNPWSKAGLMPTMTGSSLTLVRYRSRSIDGPPVLLRAMTGVEQMRCIGFDISDYAGDLLPRDRLLANLAGNAFSGFAIAPWIMAGLAALGRARQLTGEGAKAEAAVSSSQSSTASTPTASW